MTIEAFLTMLDGVKQRGSRWSAKCPSHADKSPSLSVSEGERGLLVKCWAGCTTEEICAALGIKIADLFFDALDSSPSRRQKAAQERELKRQQQALAAERQGRRIDALKAVDSHIRSRQGLDISRWTDSKLDDELNLLADAYALLASEDRDD